MELLLAEEPLMYYDRPKYDEDCLYCFALWAMCNWLPPS